MMLKYFLRKAWKGLEWIIWNAYLKPLFEMFGPVEEEKKGKKEEKIDDAQMVCATLSYVIFFMGAEKYFRAIISHDRKEVILLGENLSGNAQVFMTVNLEQITLSFRDLCEVIKENAEDIICTRIATTENFKYLYMKVSISN
ncbi:MAG: hypothetical protein AAB392_00800 [Patescibacteria group bacterium]